LGVPSGPDVDAIEGISNKLTFLSLLVTVLIAASLRAWSVK